MRKLVITAALLVLSSSALAKGEQKVYRWVDEDGNVYYGDSVPVEFRDQRKDVLDDTGVMVDSIEGKKTEEQLEQERIENERIEARAMQLRQDRALLATYLSVEELSLIHI